MLLRSRLLNAAAPDTGGGLTAENGTVLTAENGDVLTPG